MADIHFYINFDGQCEEAFNFYKSVFGGEFKSVSRFSEMPSEQPLSEADAKRILHIDLPIKNVSLMGSDRLTAAGAGTSGDRFHLSIQAESEEEVTRLFNALSAGGQVTQPLRQEFWGATFGMFIDKYGVSWLINYDHPKQ